MRLRDIAQLVLLKETYGDLDIDVLHITEDSRQVLPGSLFVAIRGNRVDGHSFARQAVEKGAVAVLAEKRCDVPVPQIVVPSTRRVAPLFANAIMDHPSRSMTMIGVTGTNGKTTTTTCIEQILQAAGKATGLIGTIEQRTSQGELRASGMTTPEAIELTRVLKEMRDLGTQYVVMETSSHALELLRAAGICYRLAVFTNLTQDHLDFHPTMEAYGRAKGHLFSRLGNDYAVCADGGLPMAILNADDDWSNAYALQTIHQVITYGIHHEADVRATNLSIEPDGATFHLSTFAGDADVSLQMTGRFNVYNAICATAVCLALGVNLPTIVATLEGMKGVSGRFERVDAGQPFTVLVDYSHTPDSLENALTTIREFCRGRVFTVVGCGGDRDRKKRPLMAQVAANYSDCTVLTSDNPRTEDPERILDDMEAGIRELDDVTYVRLVSREEGIRYALSQAKPGDVVLIAGKGHETYQLIGATYHDFDDRVVAGEIIRGAR